MTNIEQFTQQLMIAHNIDYWTALSRAEEFYDNLVQDVPSVLNDGWISVEDRLPRVGVDVIACDEDGDRVMAFHDRKYWVDEHDELGKVTHWQPLPPPPKGK